MGKYIWRPLKTSVQRWSQDDGGLLSAAMAYYAAFSLFPLCLLLVAGFGVVSRSFEEVQAGQNQMLQLVRENVGPWMADQLDALLAGVADRADVGGPIGLATLILGALGMFAQLESMFDRIWNRGGPSKGWLAALRSALRGRCVAFLMLLGIGGLLLLLLVANIALSGIRSYMVELPLGPNTWRGTQLLLALGGNALLLGILYKVFPETPIRWREAFAGGLFVAVIWQIGQQALVALLIGNHYSAYGIIGSFLAILVWFYYASAIVFLGAEYVRAICQDCK
jgi:membrane protein